MRTKKRDPKQIAYMRSVHQTCEICHVGPSEIHHIKTRGAGGSDEIKNLIALCRDHHAEVHAKGVITFALKYHLELRFSHVLKGLKL